MSDILEKRTKYGPQEKSMDELIDGGMQAVAIVVVTKDGQVHVGYRLSERALTSYSAPALMCGVDALAQRFASRLATMPEETVGNA